MLLPLLLFTLCLRLVAAADDKRLGSVQATLSLRYAGGRTLVTPGLGTPPQPLPLVLSPDVPHVAAVGHCTTCIHRGSEYDVASSTTANVIDGSTFNLTIAGQGGNASTALNLTGMIVRDALYPSANRTVHPLTLPAGLCSIRKIMGILNTTNRATSLPDGLSGYWGLGVDANASLVADACPPDGGFTVGFDLKNASVAAAAGVGGEMHWGGVPSAAYEGKFTEANWAVSLGGFQLGAWRIKSKASIAVLDPGLDGIYVPQTLAESFYASLGGTRDLVYTERWNLHCNTTAEARIWLGGVPYVLPTSAVVVPRDRLGRTCWGSVMAWTNGSVPETRGEVRLGAPFLSGVYMALHYACASKEQYVGIARKPGGPDHTVIPLPLPKPNLTTVAIVLGILFPVLLLLLGMCYLKNRYSPLGKHQRYEYEAAMQVEAHAHAQATAHAHAQAAAHAHAQAAAHAHAQAAAHAGVHATGHLGMQATGHLGMQATGHLGMQATGQAAMGAAAGMGVGVGMGVAAAAHASSAPNRPCVQVPNQCPVTMPAPAPMCPPPPARPPCGPSQPCHCAGPCPCPPSACPGACTFCTPCPPVPPPCPPKPLPLIPVYNAYTYTQYGVPVAPVAPVAPVNPVVPIAAQPTGYCPPPAQPTGYCPPPAQAGYCPPPGGYNSAQPLLYAPVVAQYTGDGSCDARPNETLGDAWLRRRRSGEYKDGRRRRHSSSTSSSS